MKQFLLVLSLLLAAAPLGAQTLRSQGPVPADLRMDVQQLFASDMERAEQYAGGRVRDKRQILESSYFINKLMAGGHIIYGDPISLLASRIADTLLKDYPALRSELRFYTVTSPGVNAFTTPQGMIFINIGLVAQLENEAQLAFIIAHEIIHYYRAHGLETLVGDNRKVRQRELDDEAEQDVDYLRRHHRSREMENEADSLGIALFYLSSPYSKTVHDGVFDILQYGNLPFDDIPFDTTFFNTPYYQLEGVWLDTVADITSRDNYDDSRSTHPNILARRHRAAQAFAGHSGGAPFVTTTPSQFLHIRQLARVECVRQDLLDGHFARAFYNCWLLLRSNPDDPTLNLYLTQSLYNIAVAKCYEREDIIADSYSAVEGESQQALYALHTMNAEQATLAALHSAWAGHRRFPECPRFADMVHHLMQLLHSPLGKAAPDFMTSANTDVQPSASPDVQPSDNPDVPMTKYERIRQKRQRQTQRKPTAYALTDLLLADSALLPILQQHLAGNADGQKSDPQATQQSGADIQHLSDTSAMLLFNPTYWVTDRHERLLVSKSDRAENQLSQRIAQSVSHFGCRTVDFSDQGMHAMLSDTQYNDFLTVCEWMREFWLSKGRFTHSRLSQPAMDSLLSRLQARTITLTAVLNNEGQPGSVSPAYAILFPFAPVVLVASLTGLEHTTMVSLVADARKGTMLARQAYSYNVADHPALIEAMLYDTYRQALRPSRHRPFGYKGHPFALAVGANLGMSGHQPLEHKHFLALSPWGSVECAVGRNHTLAFSARFQRAYPDVTQAYRVPRISSHGYYVYYDSVDVSSRNMLTLALELRHYTGSDFAPLGYYYDFGAHLTRFTTLSGSKAENTYGVHLGLGRNYIIRDHLLLNYQIDYGYTYGLMKVVGFHEDSQPYRHYADAILSNLFTVKIGIGLVP